MSREVRVIRLGFVDDEKPRSVIVTPFADYLLGGLTSGTSHNMKGGPVEVMWRPPDTDRSVHLYPVILATISEPWMSMDYDSYMASNPEEEMS
jgi:hypothetical protein